MYKSWFKLTTCVACAALLLVGCVVVGPSSGGHVSIRAVQVVENGAITVSGSSTAPSGACIHTQLIANGSRVPWWPSDTCAAVAVDGAWVLAVPLAVEGRQDALSAGVAYVVRAWLDGFAESVVEFPFDLTGPPTLSNPAAVFCAEQGYGYEIRTDADGGQYGVCIFPDGSECDEWAFLRGECGTEWVKPGPDNETGEPVEGWLGRIVQLPPGNQFGSYFEREDGERFDIGSTDPEVAVQIAKYRETGEPVQVWGRLYTGVPADQARHIEVFRIIAVNEGNAD